ncbi:MAG: transcription termination factor Rho [Solirubrobacteraceae bacterium]|jgi:transcription termination factor Rho|nr:transcription termination factor Rho [Solirubrobacteraceae bacterium]
MSAVLDRSALEQSPLADLHVIANELGVDGFRRLRKADLIDRILAGQPAGDDAATEAEEATAEAIAAADAAEEEGTVNGRSRRGRRGGRGRSRARDEDGAADEEGTTDEDADEPRRRGRDAGKEREKDKVVEGVIELLANGSGFVRLAPPEPTDDDVYVSAAQVKRCELVSGDRVSGPVRAPRRSERFPSLVRVDTINGRPADEVAEGTRFEDLPVAFPSQRLQLGSDDVTVKAIEWLTPIGKGSRVVLAGGARAGKTEALRRLAAALAGQDTLELTLVLAGIRPEEVGEWQSMEPVVAVSFAASSDAQAQAIEQAVEQGRRVAARGGDAVVLIDTLDYVAAGAARRALAAARDLVDGGSLTIIATAAAPLGGETTVVALDPLETALGRFPAIDLAASGTLRPERLVGEAGAEAIAKARAEQLG